MDIPPLGYFSSNVGGMSVRGKIRHMEEQMAHGDIRYASLTPRTHTAMIDYFIDDNRNQAFLNGLPTPFMQ